MAWDPYSERYYAIEGNTIESFTKSGLRVGAPYISASLGSCALNIPRGIAATGDGRLVVAGTGNDDINVYNVTGTVSTCVTANTTLAGTVDPLP